MKSTIAIFVLTAAAAFAQTDQPRAIQATPVPTVEFKMIPPADCSGMSLPEQYSSANCLSESLQVTAWSPDPNVGAFYILVTFVDPFGLNEWRVMVLTEKNADGKFVGSFASGRNTKVVVSALELKVGRIAYAEQQ